MWCKYLAAIVWSENVSTFTKQVIGKILKLDEQSEWNMLEHENSWRAGKQVNKNVILFLELIRLVARTPSNPFLRHVLPKLLNLRNV